MRKSGFVRITEILCLWPLSHLRTFSWHCPPPRLPGCRALKKCSPGSTHGSPSSSLPWHLFGRFSWMVFLDTASRVIQDPGIGAAPGHSLGFEPMTVPQLVQSPLLWDICLCCSPLGGWAVGLKVPRNCISLTPGRAVRDWRSIWTICCLSSVPS